MISATKKSLILSTLVVFINFIAYFTFKLFWFKETLLLESLGFTIYVSILDFIAVFLVSLAFFKKR